MADEEALLKKKVGMSPWRQIQAISSVNKTGSRSPSWDMQARPVVNSLLRRLRSNCVSLVCRLEWGNVFTQYLFTYCWTKGISRYTLFCSSISTPQRLSKTFISLPTESTPQENMFFWMNSLLKYERSLAIWSRSTYPLEEVKISVPA